MAVQFASVQTQNNWESDVGAITITKPTSLAVGDLMLAHIAYQEAATLTPATGWKNLAGTVDLATTVADTVGYKSSVQWKIAEASDVSASNFTWNFTVDTTIRTAGAIYRIIGAKLSAPIGASNQSAALNAASPSHAIGITPVEAGSLLLFLASSQGGNGTAHTGYAIATDNPSWTERYDVASTFNVVISGATATRTQTTLTGNASYTVTSGNASTDSIAFLIAITPEADPVLTPSAIALASSLPTPALMVPYSASPASIGAVSSIPSPVLGVEDNPWSNTNKSTAPDWTNQPKS